MGEEEDPSEIEAVSETVWMQPWIKAMRGDSEFRWRTIILSTTIVPNPYSSPAHRG